MGDRITDARPGCRICRKQVRTMRRCHCKPPEGQPPRRHHPWAIGHLQSLEGPHEADHARGRVVGDGTVIARPPTHFELRWAERGVAGVCGHRLTQELRRAFLSKDDDCIEFVMTDAINRPIYRFIVEGERFYAPFSPDGWPITVMDQAIIRNKKRARKFKRRVRSAVHYRREA